LVEAIRVGTSNARGKGTLVLKQLTRSSGLFRLFGLFRLSR
jgi:hypothetical protein